MNAAKETRINFCWSITTQKLCDRTVRNYYNRDEPIQPITKQRAEEYIAKAKEDCEDWIKVGLKEGKITKRQASAAYRALAEIITEAERQKEELPY